MSALDLVWVGVVVAYVGPGGPATPVVAEEPAAVAARGLVSGVEAVVLASAVGVPVQSVCLLVRLPVWGRFGHHVACARWRRSCSVTVRQA